MIIELTNDRVRNIIAKARGAAASTQEAEAFILLHGSNLEQTINKMIVEFVTNVISYSGD